ncbi:urease accessory protein UreD [Sphaerotilus sp.]|uniref:urease accessory protein UreD n=1 Tax=Sphaerotilus sp. TaxID=2093942 RepID=UPI0034E20229
MSWLGHLDLQYSLDGRRTVALDRHHGPLRVLQRLYPEGEAICHHVLVHPPGGIVGGDVLEINAELASGTHALITTPGATRYYRSAGQPAVQQVQARLEADARLEWLPMETIAYRQCLAENRLRFDLAPGAEMIGWDLLALGLPAANDHWDRGRYTQRLELPDVWLEQAVIDAEDQRLLDSPVGWAGHKVLGTMWFTAGTALPNQQRTELLDRARATIGASTLAGLAGATAPHARTVVLRVLADRVEPAMQLLVAIRNAWRATAWQLEPQTPRIWRT